MEKRETKKEKKRWFFIVSIGLAALWIGEGVFLFMKGIQLFISPHVTSAGLLTWLTSFFSKRQDAVLLLMAVGFMLAYFQGKFLLSKFIEKMTKKIQIGKFPTKEVVFFVSWAFIGSGLQLFIPEDFCGWLDFTIGASLLNSSPFYLKNLFSFKKELVG